MRIKNMNVRTAIIAFGAVALLVIGTAAQDEPIKIGVVDLQQAVSSTEEGKVILRIFRRKRN